MAENSLVAYWAVTLLGRLTPDVTDSQAKLASVLMTKQEVAVQERIAWVLGKIGATSDDARTPLG